MTLSIAILTTALLFGGMTLYSFGFAAFLFSALPPAVAGATLRRAFPAFYVFVMGAAALAAALLWSHDVVAAGLMARFPPNALTGGDECFVVTAAGRLVARSKTPNAAAVPPKVGHEQPVSHVSRHPTT